MTRHLCRFRHPPEGAMVIWEITRWCNLACTHCCTNSDPQISRTLDLTTDAIRAAIADMTDYGVREFFFSGGEPMSRPDFVDIITAIDPDRADAFVNTNGYYLDTDIAHQLASTALRRVTVSIDGHTPLIHARFRGKPASHDKAVGAVRACRTAGLPVRVSHVVGTPNVDHVEEFVTTMIDLGVDSIVVNTAFPAGRAAEHPEIMLPAARVIELEARLSLLRDQCRTGGVTLDFSMGQPEADDVPRGCPAGTRVLYVAADGTVSGCSWLHKINPSRFGVGNLNHRPFTSMVDGLRAQNAAFADHETCPLPTLTDQT
jgi:MoaA/NifB/PqqE/SkfB family radical SAM enzyme